MARHQNITADRSRRGWRRDFDRRRRRRECRLRQRRAAYQGKRGGERHVQNLHFKSSDGRKPVAPSIVPRTVSDCGRHVKDAHLPQQIRHPNFAHYPW
jgi:hypothetical protein